MWPCIKAAISQKGDLLYLLSSGKSTDFVTVQKLSWKLSLSHLTIFTVFPNRNEECTEITVSLTRDHIVDTVGILSRLPSSGFRHSFPSALEALRTVLRMLLQNFLRNCPRLKGAASLEQPISHDWPVLTTGRQHRTAFSEKKKTYKQVLKLLNSLPRGNFPATGSQDTSHQRTVVPLS